MKRRQMRSAVVSIFAGAGLSLFVGGFAHAADMAVKTPPAPVVAPYSWTGFYIGGNIGYGFGDGDIDPIGSVISFADPAIITGGPNAASASAAAATTTIRTN